MSLKYIYYKFVIFGTQRGHLLLVNTVMAAVASYFVIQKLTGWSLTNFVIFHNYVTQGQAHLIRGILIGVIIYCAISKLLILVAEAYPINKAKGYNLVDLAFCAYSINNEIEKHFTKLMDKKHQNDRAFLNSHAFEENLVLVVKMLSEYIKKSFPSLPLSESDILISVYKIPNFEALPRNCDQLACVTYNNLGIEGQMNSPKIIFEDIKYKDYECVKCIRDNKDRSILYSCKDYAKFDSERQKSVKHYAGWRIDWNGHPLGFINIEFHNQNHDYFYDKQSYEKFIQEHVLVFKHLIKYQFIKRLLFSRLQSIYPPKK